MATKHEHNKFLEQLEQEVAEAVYDAQRKAIEEAPVDTGRLRQSIRVDKTPDGWVIGTNLEYAEYQEVGTETVPPTFFMQKAALHFEESLKKIARRARI